jgi:hypothetical protein
MAVRSRPLPRAPRLALVLAALGLLVPALAVPKPGNFGTDEAGGPITARWPDNTTIHVYIPTPPNPPGNCSIADIHAGIQKWALALAARGITIQFHDNQPQPVGSVNSVGVRWVAPGTFGGDDQGYGQANTSDTPQGEVIDDGYIECETDEACGQGMSNVFAHEFGHVLGFDDDETVEGQPRNVMDPDVPDTPVEFSPADSAELRSLYGCFSEGPPYFPKGLLTQSVTPVGGDPPQFVYDYTIEWLAGPDIPVFDVTLGCLPNQVTVLGMPPTWQFATPPFYRDCSFDPPATAATRELHFHANGQALNGAYPTGVFTIQCTAPPVMGWALPLIDADDDGFFEKLPVLVPGVVPTTVPVSGPVTGATIRWLVPRPNPFRESTVLRFAATSAWQAGTLDVFDVNGRLVRSLALAPGGPGEMEVRWDGRSGAGALAGPGAYFVRVALDDSRAMGTVLRVR